MQQTIENLEPRTSNPDFIDYLEIIIKRRKLIVGITLGAALGSSDILVWRL